jgi:hypothetical protein
MAARAGLEGRMIAPRCRRCGDHRLVFPLHGVEKGGPLVCPACAVGIDETFRYQRNRERAALGLDALKGHSGPTYLTRELLIEVLALTHPDKHPPERTELATRVTAELNALKPYVPDAPKPKPPPPAVTDKTSSPPERINIRDLLDSVCVDCLGLVSLYYCDACRAKWEEGTPQRDRR